MKRFIKKNKFFVSLLLLALSVILLLSIIIIQKNNDLHNNGKTPEEKIKGNSNKETVLSQFSASYNRISTGNSITVSWGYTENNAKVTSVYLYLNDNEGINVTQNHYYDFTQNVYDYATGDNKIRIVLNLDNGKTIEKETIVFVEYIMSAKQEVIKEGSTIRLTLEYVFSSVNPVKAPEILITNMPSEVAPVVHYIDTQIEDNGTKSIARTTFAFVWKEESEIPLKWSVRWKFNEIQDSFDFTVNKPQ